MSRRRHLSDTPPAQAVVDGQVLSRDPNGPVIGQQGNLGPDLTQPPPPSVTVNPGGYAPPVDESSDPLTVYLAAEQKARALSAFVKIPFFVYCSFNGDLPSLVRLGAAALGFLEVRQLMVDPYDANAALPDLPQGY